MHKFFSIVIVGSLLSGCSIIDPMISGSEKATVVAVRNTKGQKCLVVFNIAGDKRHYVSVPSTPYKDDRCRQLSPGQTVPIVRDPVVGDYPYVLFENIVG